MNYTLIAYNEDSSYHDRCGDYIHRPGSFEIFFTTDKVEIIETWAKWSLSNKYETLELLLNGVPDQYQNEADSAIWYELDDARIVRTNEIIRETKLEKERQEKEEAIRKSEALALETKRKAELQRLRDLETLAALRKQYPNS